jgi:hypothetical protein
MKHARQKARDELAWMGSMLLRMVEVALLLLLTIGLIVAGCVGIAAALIWLLNNYVKG